MKGSTTTKHTMRDILPTPAFGLNASSRAFPFSFQLWFYPPPSRISAEDNYLCTAGLAEQSFAGACPRVELSFQFPGKFQRRQLEKLGVFLGEMIYDTLKITHFTPNLLITGLQHPLMPAMSDVLVMEGAGLRPLWLEAADQSCIRMLHLIPVYRTEVPLIRQMGGWNTYRQFIARKINFMQPGRPPLTEITREKTECQLARHVDLKSGEVSTEQVRKAIRDWYETNAPEVPAATSETIPKNKTERQAFFGLPSTAEPPLPGENDPHRLNLLWEYLYAGAFLPGRGPSLKRNPHFVPPP